MSYYKLKI